MANFSRAHRLRVGTVEVDPESGRLLGPAGMRKLDPRVMAVLLRLVREPGRIVARETLMHDVWGDVVVTDFALSRCIYQLRKVLAAASGTDAAAIETLPKRGYRLLWKVDAPIARTRSDGGFVVAAVSTAILFVGISLWTSLGTSPEETADAPGGSLRLVIYPFQDLSDAQNQRVFAEGLSREIQHRLAAVPALTLIGRTSAFEPGRNEVDPTAFAARLDARYLLSGSVQTVGSTRRVLADLREVPDDEVLWSREFVIDDAADFYVVRDLADRVVEWTRFAADTDYLQKTTASLGAFEAYAAAHEAPDKASRRKALLRAVEFDPGFAQAWNALAAMEIYPVWNGQQTVEDAWQVAQPYIEKVLAINPDLPDVYVTLGRFRREFHDLDGAIGYFEKALELDPGSPAALANLGIVLRPAGRYEEALQVHQLAASLDPLDALAQARLATSYWLMEDHDAAARHYAIAAEMLPGNEEIYDSWSAMLSLGDGRFDDAMEKLEIKMRIERDPTPRTLHRAGELASVLGLDDMAEQFFHEAGSESLANLAMHYLASGNDEAALTLAEQALELSSTDEAALSIIGTFAIESGRPDRFLERVLETRPELHATEQRNIGITLLVAAAYAVNGRHDVADPLAQSVIDCIGRPHAYQHLWLAAAHAIRGDTDAALSELQDSPPGWIRQKARILLRDPRFAALQGDDAFLYLVAAHVAELDRQRGIYLSRHTAGAEVGKHAAD